MRKVSIRQGDLVAVRTGKDVGRRGKVLEVRRATGRVVVDGINIVKRHTRPNPKNPQGGVVERPAPLAISNVMLVCPSCDRPSRLRHGRSAEGKRIRICARCGKSID
ncbi:MAG: 50S ribosomal protein L24 [Limnochordaceae bacterium]|nr:50S ribosomal protein L24 [Limnochordaceae bacterium]